MDDERLAKLVALKQKPNLIRIEHTGGTGNLFLKVSPSNSKVA